MFSARRWATSSTTSGGKDASSPSSSTSAQQQQPAAAAAAVSTRDISVEAVWALWNEGNLFSLGAPDLSQFLTNHSVTVNPNWKKAALVRQVEEVLRAREAQRKQQPGAAAAASGASGATAAAGDALRPAAVGERKESDVYGRWEGQSGGASGPVGGAGRRSEMLLDLSASGFYSGQGAADATAAAVPKAFQLFPGGATPDLVLSRVNTTSFPGFAANAECFTFTGADTQLSTRSRYSKTTQWSILNARHMNLPAEITADLGKLVLRPDVVKRSRYVVSVFALQQRVQQAQATSALWVSATSSRAASALEAVLVGKNGFVAPTTKELTYEARIRRKNDTVTAELDAKGNTTAVYSQFTNIQTAYWMSPTVGQDVRYLVRSRKTLAGAGATAPGDAEAAEFLKTHIVDIESEEAKSLLKPNLGEVVYASENETRTFVKNFDAYQIKVVETTRQPLIISRNEEDGARTELTVKVTVPMQAAADKFDLPRVTEAVYDLGVELAAAATEQFVSEFSLSADPVITSVSGQ